jgi:hypothetical protein
MEAPERIITREDSRPGASPSEPRRRTASLTAIAVVVGALVGGGAVLAWDRIGRSDTDRGLEQAQDQRDDALREVDALTTRVTDLQGRLRAGSEEAAALQVSLDRVRERLASLAGPRLEDGRHLGYLMALGASQQPPRLVFDLAEWFTDQEAIEAALADGVPREDAGINGYYIRNESPRWRILSIDRDATVVLTTSPVADPAHPVEVTLDRFGELFASHDGYLPLSPYWLTVRGGIVVAIEEQFVP